MIVKPNLPIIQNVCQKSISVFVFLSIWLFVSPVSADELPKRTEFKSGFLNLSPSTLSSDGKTVLTYADNNLVSIDLDTGTEVFSRAIAEAHEVALAPDGRYLVQAYYDDGIELISIETGKRIWYIDDDIEYPFNSAAVLEFGPFGRRIVVALSDSSVGRLHILDASSGKLREIETETITSSGVAFSDDGLEVYVVGSSSIERYDLVSGKSLATRDIFRPKFMQHLPHVKMIAVFGNERLQLFDYELNEVSKVDYPTNFDGGKYSNQHYFLSPDANTLLITSSNGNFATFDLRTLEMASMGRESGFDSDPFGHMPFSMLSDDGGTLTGVRWQTRESTLTVFDLPKLDWSDLEAFSALITAKNRALVELKAGDISSFKAAVTPEMIFGDRLSRPLIYDVAVHGTAAAVFAVVEMGADIDALDGRTGESSVIAAVKSGNVETTEALVSLGASTQAISRGGETFVSSLVKAEGEAFKSTSLAGLKAQLDSSFSPDRIDGLLFDAVAGGDVNVVATLISLGANPNKFNDKGLTALMIAAASKTQSALENVRMLLKWGNADPNIANQDGATALALAIASEADMTLIRTLLAVSDLERSDYGAYAWDVAQSVGATDVLAILPAQGWKPPNIPMPRIGAIEIPLNGNMSKLDIQKVQQRLKEKGLYTSSIDGLWGPASRRGLASYFKVVFDDYHSVLEDFCSVVQDDVMERFRQTDDYLGEGNVNDTFWQYKGFMGLGVDVIADSKVNGLTITCELRLGITGNNFTDQLELWAAHVSYENTRVTVDFVQRCQSTDDWLKSQLWIAEQPVAVDFGCRNSLAGVPVKGSTATHWQKY